MEDVQRQRVGWKPQQWAALDAAVEAEVTRLRVVENIIPTINVNASDKTVTIDRINPVTRTIDDQTTHPLPEISVQFILDKQQVEQAELTRGLALARRAAIDFARIEDAMFLLGLAAIPNGYAPEGYSLPAYSDIQRGQDRVPFGGLAGDPRNDARQLVGRRPHHVQRIFGGGPTAYGPAIVSAVADAIAMLETAGHMGPYHLILGREAFVAALTPNAPALVLPKDRIEPLLASPIRRSPALQANQGVLLSVGGDPNDRVVAVEPTLRFIELTPQDRYRFRVYGVLALRRKEPEATVRLSFS